MLKYLVLFIGVPLLDVYLLFALSGVIGGINTIAMVILTGVLGASLSRLEGARVLQQWQASLAEGRVPEEGVLGGVLWLLGSALLITPGVITDAVGLILLLAPSRRFVARLLRPWLRERVKRVAVDAQEQPRVRVVRIVDGFEGFDGVDPFAAERQGGQDSVSYTYGSLRSEGGSLRSEGERRRSTREPPREIIDVEFEVRKADDAD